MGYVMTYDVGTTAIKGVLLSTTGEVVTSESVGIDTQRKDIFIEQDPEQWIEAVGQMGRSMSQSIDASEITAVIMSGQMQDLILVDESGMCVMPAILYSDARAEEEAEVINNALGFDNIREVTGNALNGSFPLAKLLWVKKNRKEEYDKSCKLVISAKDYCVGRITGQWMTDTTSAATSGFLDFSQKLFREDWFDKLDVNKKMIPMLKKPMEIVGDITGEGEKITGIPQGTPVYAGIGDAGATTLASGINDPGEVNINLGTSGWVAAIGQAPINREGVFNLVAADAQNAINVVPFLNAGNVHKWIAGILFNDGVDYEAITRMLDQRTSGSNGLVFLPYLQGERFPVMDAQIRACYYGLRPETTSIDMVSAALEGVAFSLRNGLEELMDKPEKITLIGGGAKEKHWCQIFSDVLGKPITVFSNSEYRPARSMITMIDESYGKQLTFEELEEYYPNMEMKNTLEDAYKTFKSLYPRLKGV